MDPDIEIQNIDYVLNCEMSWDYAKSMYFMVITMTTVGYGEINPQSEYGQGFNILIMMATLIILPQQTSELLDLIKKQSKYRTMRYSKSSEETHIIITGDITLQAMGTFCRELFHPEHLQMKGQAVIIQNFDPSPNMQHILGTYETKVTYLAGSVLDKSKLLRGETGKAEACILLANKNSKQAKEQDFRNILQALSLKRHVYDMNKGDKKDDEKHNMKIVMQLIKPESKLLYKKSLNLDSIHD